MSDSKKIKISELRTAEEVHADYYRSLSLWWKMRYRLSSVLNQVHIWGLRVRSRVRKGG